MNIELLENEINAISDAIFFAIENGFADDYEELGVLYSLNDRFFELKNKQPSDIP